MSQPQDYSLIRRILLPFSGNETITPGQRWRVMIAWGLVFTLPMLLCTLLVGLAAKSSTEKLITLLTIVFLAGIIIFGATAAFAVSSINRSVRLREQRKEQANK
jgi:hypothetical protein